MHLSCHDLVQWDMSDFFHKLFKEKRSVNKDVCVVVCVDGGSCLFGDVLVVCLVVSGVCVNDYVVSVVSLKFIQKH